MKNDELVKDDTRKKQKLAPKPPAANAWVPSLKDRKGETILVKTNAFNAYVLRGKIDQAMSSLEDYDYVVGLKEKEHQGRLERARY